MISISSIKTYMYCPLKLYFQSQVDEDHEEEDYFVPKTLKDLRIDIQDILHKNIRQVKRDMDLMQIEEALSKGIFKQVDTTFEIIEELNETKNYDDFKNQSPSPNDGEIEFLDDEKRKSEKRIEEIAREKEELENLKEELIDEINLNLKILSLKAFHAMKALDNDGNKIQSLFFQSTMYNYLIRDLGLGMIGMIDKIEVEKGRYFPILLKSSNPPLRGVWDGDRVELIANAILVEEEFDTHIAIGFVDYLKIGERRPIVIDSIARKEFFKVLTKINKILEKGEIPNVNPNLNKCKNCEYKYLCEKEWNYKDEWEINRKKLKKGKREIKKRKLKIVGTKNSWRDDKIKIYCFQLIFLHQRLL